MRSILLICATILLLAVGFFAYLWFQPAVAERPINKVAQRIAASRPSSTTKISGLGSGESAWILRIDPKTGELASRFRGDRYDPQPGNIVFVDQPRAEFFSNDGKQRIHIAGQKGRVHVAGATANQQPGTFAGKMEAPTRGLLEDVIVTIFEPSDAPDPSVTIRMNNASFDNDAFRLETQSFIDPATGRRVEADQVPVELRGIDYDFDGRGLILLWNERDRKLQLLEIAHGERLTLKNLKLLNNKTEVTALTPPPQILVGATPASRLLLTPSPGTPGEGWGEGHHSLLSPLPYQLVSTDPRAIHLIADTPKKPTLAQRRRAATQHAATQATTHPHITRDLSPTVYRATFHDAVQIFDVDTRIATADIMNVDFLQNPSKSTTQPTTTPTITTSPSATNTQLTADASQKRPKKPSTQPLSHATTQPPNHPTTNPSPQQGPITIKWTGKLHVVPLEGAPDPTLEPNKALVELVGSPVTLDKDQSRITCGNASYNSANQSAELRASATVPVVTMTDARGAVVKTPHMIYTEKSPTEKVATLIGPSTADIPDTSEPGKTQLIKTRWQDQCLLHFATDAQNRTSIHRADLNGSVVVNHPKLDLTSNAMALTFVPAPAKHATTAPTTSPTTSPTQTIDAQLKEVLAIGNVHAQMHDTEGATQTISTRQLKVETETDPQGKTFARTIEATDDVHTHSPDGDLTAGYLLAKLKPTTRKTTTAPTTQLALTPNPTTQPLHHSTTDPSHSPTTQPTHFASGADHESLTAKTNVRFATTQGTAAADTLEINSTTGPQKIRLIGAPASVTTGSTLVTSTQINFTPSLNLAEIPAPGKLHATSQPTTRHSPSPATPPLPPSPGTPGEGRGEGTASTTRAIASPTTSPSPLQSSESVDIDWQGQATINGNTNKIHITDNVHVISKQIDGTLNTATANQLDATLVSRTPPTTQAATQPADVTLAPSPARKDPTTKKSKDPNAPLMQDKDIATVTLLADPGEKVEIKSELHAPNGDLLRGFNLFAQQVNYDKIHGTMTVPVPGQMLYQDHRQSETAKAEGPTIGSGRGATAFEWKDSLHYDDTAHQATLKGDVRIVHKPQNNQDQPFKLDAQLVTADFAPSSTTQPADKEKMHLNLVTAKDQVHVNSARATLDAYELKYNPATATLDATGADQDPGTLYDNNNGSTTIFSKVQWNTETDQFKVTKASGRMRR